MKRSPRLHLEQLEDRITPIGPVLFDPTYLPPPPPDQVVVTPPPPAPTYYIPTPADMVAAMNAYLASLPPPPTGGDIGLGTGLGGGSLP
ncbi:MAG TPA: hypothetical protein DDY78_04540 [Planctomycetales bacterium]|jgi:hypothetical protein|nr:hypothetical protein [Planctomycetales bacterium]